MPNNYFTLYSHYIPNQSYHYYFTIMFPWSLCILILGSIIPVYSHDVSIITLYYITVDVPIIIPVYSRCDSSIFPSYSQYIPLYIRYYTPIIIIQV